MTKKLVVSIAAAALLLGAGCRREEHRARRGAEQEATGGAGMTQSSSGRVEQASQAEVVVVDPAGNVLHLRVDPNTQVVIAGRAASAADIQPGSDVRASYDASTPQPRATRIDVQPPSGAGGAPSQQQ